MPDFVSPTEILAETLHYLSLYIWQNVTHINSFLTNGKLVPGCLSVAQYLCLSKMKSNYAFFLSLYKFTPNIENQWNKL